MSLNRMLMVFAGTALSIGAPALAQSANQDNSRAYAAELVSDSATRSSLLAQSTGYDRGGFMIGSADGNSSLYIFGSAQIRYYADFRDSDDDAQAVPGVPPVENFTHGFENRLTRLGVRGTVWDKNLGYQVRGQFGNDQSFGLETGFVTYKWDNGFGILAGQFKSPLFRESMVDNEYQLAVERSVTSFLFGDSYTQGLQFTYASDAFRGWFGFTDGINSANTPFNSGVTRGLITDRGEADYALNARVEFKAMGSGWERFDDFTSWKSSEDMGLLIGAAIWWQDTGETGGTTGVDANGDELPSLQNLLYTLDAQFEGQGWNLFGAFYGSHQDSDAEGASTDNFGIVLQGGIFVTDQVELFARWDAVLFDDEILNSAGEEAEDQHFITAGVNYYLSPESHAAKLSADVIWALESTADLYAAGDPANGISAGPIQDTRFGLLGTSEENEFALRLQFQVVY